MAARISSVRFAVPGLLLLTLTAVLGGLIYYVGDGSVSDMPASPGNFDGDKTTPIESRAPDFRPVQAETLVSHSGTEQGPDEAGEDVPDVPPLTRVEEVNQHFGTVRANGVWLPLGDTERAGNTGNADASSGIGHAVSGGVPPVYITNGTLPPGRVGESYSIQLEAVGGVKPYRWSVDKGPLPAGIDFDADSGVLTGIPGESSTTALRIRVTDASFQSDVAGYELVIEPEEALVIVTDLLPSARAGEDYSFSLEAEGGIPPYEWSISGDASAIGSLTLDPLTGRLSGSIDSAARGREVLLTIQVQDDQVAVSKELLLKVGADQEDELEIVTKTLPDGRENEDYAIPLEVEGGHPPYRWLTEVALPEGLTFSSSGLLSGMPVEQGLFEIGFQVQDSEGNWTSANLPLRLRSEREGITQLTAFRSLRRVALEWTYPAEFRNAVAIVVRTIGAPAASPNDGVLVYRGPGSSVIDRGLDPETYHYTAFLAGEDPELVAPARLEMTLPEGDPFADLVSETALLHPQAYKSFLLPGIVTGAPAGFGLARGSLDVVSLGADTHEEGSLNSSYGGSILLEFADNVVWDGPGADFTVFENVYYLLDEQGNLDPDTRFMEPAIVSVSQDGNRFFTFPFDFSPRYDGVTGELNLRHPFVYNRGFAGVNPVLSNGFNPDPTDPELSGGDSFDLSELGLEWIRFVRIQSTGNRWLVDENGDVVSHPEDTGAASREFNKSGFDLDAASAVWFERVQSSP